MHNGETLHGHSHLLFSEVIGLLIQFFYNCTHMVILLRHDNSNLYLVELKQCMAFLGAVHRHGGQKACYSAFEGIKCNEGINSYFFTPNDSFMVVRNCLDVYVKEFSGFVFHS